MAKKTSVKARAKASEKTRAEQALDFYIRLMAKSYAGIPFGQEREKNTGAYGPVGWTVVNGIVSSVLPFTEYAWCEEEEDRFYELVLSRKKPRLLPDYIRFEWLPWKAIEPIIDRIPKAGLLDRQNDGPSLEDSFEIMRSMPDRVFAGGYLIGPSRDDERITIDNISIGLTLEERASSAVIQCLSEDGIETLDWDETKNKYLPNSQCEPPDELRNNLYSPNGEKDLMRAWWD